MRKLMTCAVGTVLAMTMLTGTASAGGVAGPYKSKLTCLERNKAYDQKYTVGPCYRKGSYWYFQYK